MSDQKGVFLSRGKTDDEIKAQREARELRDLEMFSVELTRKQIRDASGAAFEAQYLMHNAANIMQFLRDSISGGFADQNDAGAHAILEMCSRGFLQAAETDGVALSAIATKLMDHKALYNDTK